jgi:PEGA domain
MAKSVSVKTSARMPRRKGGEANKGNAMSIEYLLVTFSEERAVLADGAGVGFTNHTLMLPADEYSITLSGDGYQPQSQDVALSGTAVMKPKVVAFTPIATPATKS